MYCVNCGVELADSEKSCPLCGTKVYHPDIVRNWQVPPYPEFVPNDAKVNRRSILFIVSILFLALIAQLVICEISVSSARGWAGYAIGAVTLAYILVVLPLWFKAPNPVIFVPCDFAAILAYLLYIELVTSGGWFLSFAFPVVGAIALISSAVAALLKYVRRGYLYIFGGAIIAHGGFMVLLEFLLNLTFGVSDRLKWSFFPLFGCLIIGMGLIVIAICKPIRESLRKKLFF